MAVRFRILLPLCPLRWRHEYMIQIHGRTIPVYHPRLGRFEMDGKILCFDWSDGHQYAAAGPISSLHGISITVDGQSVGFGFSSRRPPVVDPHSTPDSRTIRIGAWDIGGEQFICEGRRLRCNVVASSVTLRQQGSGVRVATWFLEARDLTLCSFVQRVVAYSGVIRGNLHDRLVPIVLGIVLASEHHLISSRS